MTLVTEPIRESGLLFWIQFIDENPYNLPGSNVRRTKNEFLHDLNVFI
jgi:hypothetical protein